MPSVTITGSPAPGTHDVADAPVTVAFAIPDGATLGALAPGNNIPSSSQVNYGYFEGDFTLSNFVYHGVNFTGAWHQLSTPADNFAVPDQVAEVSQSTFDVVQTLILRIGSAMVALSSFGGSDGDIAAAIKSLWDGGGGVLSLKFRDSPPFGQDWHYTCSALRLTLFYASGGGGGGGGIGPGPGDHDAAITPGPSIAHDSLCRYYMADDHDGAGDVFFWYAESSIPKPGWKYTRVQITHQSSGGGTTKTYGEPCVAIRGDGRVLVACTRKTVTGSTAYDGVLFTSSDQGATWSTETVILPGAIRSRLRVHPQTKAELVVGNAGGALIGAYRGDGDAAYSAAFNLIDQTGANITVDSIHDISPSADGADRWLLACQKHLDSGLSQYIGTDHGRSWKLLT